MGKLTDKLKKIDTMPMHMPGHKRNTSRFPQIAELIKLDITEIDGFDNLHSPDGIIKESMKRASVLFKSENSIYLVNGSTCGILAGICSILNTGDKVILDRLSHQSVYNAVELCGAEPIYLLPEFHNEYNISVGITPDSIENALLKNPDARLIVITSPTYEGAVSDIEGICRVAHSHNVPVLVDSAHGAHLGFYKFPKSATECGADIVIESLHKTLPCLTQTAICHVKNEYLAGVLDKLSVFESSSPSYILMSSIDRCMDIIENEEIFRDWYGIVCDFINEVSSLKNLKVLKKDNGFFDFDMSKLVIFTNDAKKLSTELRKNGIEPEMTAPYYVVCMTGAGDTKDTLNRLKSVLFELDCKFSGFNKNILCPGIPHFVMSARNAKSKDLEYVSFSDAFGRICAEYIRAYPPGIPILAPGELIEAETLDMFSLYTENNIELIGGHCHIPDKILVLKS